MQTHANKFQWISISLQYAKSKQFATAAASFLQSILSEVYNVHKFKAMENCVFVVVVVAVRMYSLCKFRYFLTI